MNSINTAVPVATIVSSPIAALQTPELYIRQRRELGELLGIGEASTSSFLTRRGEK